MPPDGLLERLDAGEVLVLDGAVGTELQRRGVPMDSEAWCGLANLSHPDEVAAVHADYIAAGADLITTNTFATARHVLEGAGHGDLTEPATREAVVLARRAAAEAGRPDVLVLGSMSSMAPLGSWQATPTGAEVVAAYREQAAILAAAGADALVAEMMLDIPNAALVIEAAIGTGLPVLVGWSGSPDGRGGVATFRSDLIERPEPGSFDDLMRRGVALGGDVHGIMHSAVDVTGPALRILARHWDGPTMAYPETGRFEPPDWVFTDDLSPGEYGEQSRRWVGGGVQIVGGCCGTTPEHIAATVAAVTEHRETRRYA